MAKKSRFTFRSLYHDGRDIEEQAVWSATPGTDDVAWLQAIRDALESADPARLLTPREEQEALDFVRIDYPDVTAVRFEFDPPTVRLDEDLRVVYVDIAGRVHARNGAGEEFTTEEYDHYAAQTAMALLERHISRTVGAVQAE